MMDEFIHDHTLFVSCQQLMMKYCHGWLKFGWKITWSSTIIATMKILSPPKSQGMTNYIGLTFKVGDTMPRFTRLLELAN